MIKQKIFFYLDNDIQNTNISNDGVRNNESDNHINDESKYDLPDPDNDQDLDNNINDMDIDLDRLDIRDYL